MKNIARIGKEKEKDKKTSTGINILLQGLWYHCSFKYRGSDVVGARKFPFPKVLPPGPQGRRTSVDFSPGQSIVIVLVLWHMERNVFLARTR